MFYSVTLNGARLVGIRQEVPNTLDPALSVLPVMERVSFNYNEIIVSYAGTGAYEYGTEWRCLASKVPFSDLNFDGVVNMLDFAIIADEWLMLY
jgi:hypothetical protein